LIEQGLTSPPTQYRLYGRRFFTGHKTQPTVSKYWRNSLYLLTVMHCIAKHKPAINECWWLPAVGIIITTSQSLSKTKKQRSKKTKTHKCRCPLRFGTG